MTNQGTSSDLKELFAIFIQEITRSDLEKVKYKHYLLQKGFLRNKGEI